MIAVAALCKPNGEIIQIIGVGLSKAALERRADTVGRKVWELASERTTQKLIRSAFANCVFTGNDQSARFTLPDPNGSTRRWAAIFFTADEDVLVMARPIAAEAPELSDLQFAVLNAILTGMAVKQIPEALKVTPSAVHRALRTLRKKLAAENTHGIVVAARRYGLW